MALVWIRLGQKQGEGLTATSTMVQLIHSSGKQKPLSTLAVPGLYCSLCLGLAVKAKVGNRLLRVVK